jgi:hypothetical protein
MTLEHGAEHRSQVCAALATFGIEAAVSVWHYGMTHGLIRESMPGEGAPGR